MKNDKDSINLLLSLGYIQKDYGYVRVSKRFTHWVSLFDKRIQMYSYFTGGNLEKEYDTGIIAVNEKQFRLLAAVFLSNFN